MTIAAQLEQRLNAAFNPTHLYLENESHMHGGYVEGKESHFKLTMVSDQLEAKRLVQRHQAIYAAVSGLLTSGGGSVHALAIHAYTPDEWQTQVTAHGSAPESPNCANRK